jgi:arsenate reductase
MEISLFDRINLLDTDSVTVDRKDLLKPIKEYLILKTQQKVIPQLNFICTHNSRRSQLSQVWANVVADFYGYNVNCFSGGTEITACNERTIASFERMGFTLLNPGGENPHYELSYHENKTPIVLFSKIYDDFPNPKNNFAAVMTCSHADKNCPFIPGSDKRIALPYEDPKAADDTPKEAEIYDERSLQIAAEMKYVFCDLLG